MTSQPILEIDHDHDDLSALLQDLAALVQQSAIDATRERALREARQLIRYFVQDMSEHFVREERLLFPTLKEYLPDKVAVVEGLARAHEQFMSLGNNISERLTTQDVDRTTLESCLADIERLRSYFHGHSHTEVQLLRTMDSRIREPSKRQELRELLAEI